MRKLHEFFKVLQFQKRMVAEETMWENTVGKCVCRHRAWKGNIQLLWNHWTGWVGQKKSQKPAYVIFEWSLNVQAKKCR